jgi:hypothetical protein
MTNRQVTEANTGVDGVGFLTGALLVTAIVGFWAANSTDIDQVDFYRFCMTKNIPLDECKTPPYEDEKHYDK